MRMPSRPSSASLGTSSLGNRSSSSHLRAWGATSLRAKSRTVFRRSAWCSEKSKSTSIGLSTGPQKSLLETERGTTRRGTSKAGWAAFGGVACTRAVRGPRGGDAHPRRAVGGLGAGIADVGGRFAGDFHVVATIGEPFLDGRRDQILEDVDAGVDVVGVRAVTRGACA